MAPFQREIYQHYSDVEFIAKRLCHNKDESYLFLYCLSSYSKVCQYFTHYTFREFETNISVLSPLVPVCPVDELKV